MDDARASGRRLPISLSRILSLSVRTTVHVDVSVDDGLLEEHVRGRHGRRKFGAVYLHGAVRGVPLATGVGHDARICERVLENEARRPEQVDEQVDVAVAEVHDVWVGEDHVRPPGLAGLVEQVDAQARADLVGIGDLVLQNLGPHGGQLRESPGVQVGVFQLPAARVVVESGERVQIGQVHRIDGKDLDVVRDVDGDAGAVVRAGDVDGHGGIHLQVVVDLGEVEDHGLLGVHPIVFVGRAERSTQEQDQQRPCERTCGREAVVAVHGSLSLCKRL